jgi:hypothetical protein
MVIIVDIDETICEHPGTDPHSPKDYANAVPIKSNIEKINKLYEEGNTIIYWTARGTVTGIDWTEVTRQQLKEWGALHHELNLGKPFYNLFICDKAINSLEFFKD